MAASPSRKRKPARARDKATPTRIAIAEKEAKALELRKAGATYEKIAAALGYAGRDGAYRAVNRALADLTQEPAEELRTLELERLDAMQLALWRVAMDTGNRQQPRAVEMVLAVMARRAALLGLDAPKRRIVEQYSEEIGQRLAREIEAELEAEGDGPTDATT
jgi:hypothetical protein